MCRTHPIFRPDSRPNWSVGPWTMAETGLFYARFMDDWVVLAPTRWKLREAIRAVNQALSALKV